MSKNARDKRPYIRPVTRIQLSENNVKLRMILIVVVLSIAVVAVVYGLMSMLNTEPGWQEVEVSSANANCSQDFVLMYEFGKDGVSATEEYRAVSGMYTQLTEFGYQIFSADAQIPDLGNVYFLNRHPNERVIVAHELYLALELLEKYESRYLFLGPVYDVYDAVFLSETSAEAALYDPVRNPELAAYVQETATFCADPDMIHVELLGDDQVELVVAEEYLVYARENGIETLLDFGWMTNAFIADYMAETLAASQYTNGYLASYDGFTRNLDDRGNRYSFNLFDRMENTISMPARMHYDVPMSIVFLRNYPLSEQDRWHYFAYDDGDIATTMLSPVNGMRENATDNLVGYSTDFGCAEILLQMAPYFIAPELAEEKLLSMERVEFIWGQDNALWYTDPEAELEILAESGGADYRLEIAK